MSLISELSASIFPFVFHKSWLKAARRLFFSAAADLPPATGAHAFVIIVLLVFPRMIRNGTSEFSLYHACTCI